MKIFGRNTTIPTVEEVAAQATASALEAVAGFRDIANQLNASADELDFLSGVKHEEAEAHQAKAAQAKRDATAAVDQSVEFFEEAEALRSRAAKISELTGVTA